MYTIISLHTCMACMVHTAHDDGMIVIGFSSLLPSHVKDWSPFTSNWWAARNVHKFNKILNNL